MDRTRKSDYVWIDEATVFSNLDLDALSVYFRKPHQRRLGVAAQSQQNGANQFRSDVTAQSERGTQHPEAVRLQPGLDSQRRGLPLMTHRGLKRIVQRD